MHTLLVQDDRRHLRERLLRLQADDAGLWGVMNAVEMVCHVRGAFRMAMGELPFETVTMPMPGAVLKAGALWTPMPWRHNFTTVPALRRGAPAMQSCDFTADLAETAEEMERFCQPEQVRVDHAFFGKMSTRDWMRWGYLHTDHHLRQFGR